MTAPTDTSPPAPRKRRVLFLCTGNSARSQIAEWLVNHFFGGRWEAQSAGTAPAGFVHPLALQVAGELGVAVSSLRSKSVDEFRDQEFDVVMTLCDAAAEDCPVWLGRGRVVHRDFPDPAAATGSPAERLAAFRWVRDAIREEVLGYLGRAADAARHVPGMIGERGGPGQ